MARLLGFEEVARATHGESPRRSGPFLSVNCAALPEQLLEAELFGYAHGAFSGAEEDRAGLLAKAHGGTFFLDEIGDLPLSLQGKLLRVLDRGTLRPLGSSDEIEVDVRCVFSSNRQLEGLVEESTFRRDFYFRLGRFEIRVPPLRERLEDLPLLVEHFRNLEEREDVPVFDESALRALASYPWPGNVRELKNVITRLVLTCSKKVAEKDVRRALGKTPEKALFSTAQLRSRSLDELKSQLEKEYLLQLSADCGSDLKAVAASLGITLRALYTSLRRLGVRPRELR